MKAIVTTYRGATDTRGGRIVAKAEGVRPVTTSYGYEGDQYQEHERAAQALCDKYGWSGRIVGGGLPDGRSMAWVFVDKSRGRDRTRAHRISARRFR